MCDNRNISIFVFIIKKEVIHPQVPLRIPCDDLTPLTELRIDHLKKGGLF